MVKIFHATWHVPHDYSLFNIPDTEWYCLQNNVKRWNYFARPLPKNVHYVPFYEQGKYDLAILDVDQQCVDVRIGKGRLYRALNEEIQDIPKIVINHGTPFWYENWTSRGDKSWRYFPDFDDSDMSKTLEYQKNFLVKGGKCLIGGELAEVDGMEKMIGKNRMVVNSFKSQEQWGWGKVIWHGIDSNEWLDLPKSPRSVTMISTGGLDYYYGRELLNSTISRLRDDFGLVHTWISHPGSWTIYDSNLFSRFGGWEAFKDFLGRSLIYFNPTKESCMPRSRLEAMMSGCCILTTGNQDEEKFINLDSRKLWASSEGVQDFIKNLDEMIELEGVNGIIVPENPLAIAAIINHLIYVKPDTAKRIGQEGKKTAKILFSKEKFDTAWTKLINKVLENKK